MSNEIKVGDVVRVKDPSGFVSAFAKKVADRDAIVERVGPDKHGQFKGFAFVRFLRRNGRGKEFTQRLALRDLILCDEAAESQP